MNDVFGRILVVIGLEATRVYAAKTRLLISKLSPTIETNERYFLASDARRVTCVHDKNADRSAKRPRVDGH